MAVVPGSSPITGAIDGANTVMSMYTPATGDVGSRLRARAMYDDAEDEDKTAQEDSANSVRRAAPRRLATPTRCSPTRT